MSQMPTSATGGSGSYPTDLLGTLVYGLNRAIDGAYSKNFGQPKLPENAYVDADGNVQLAGSPSAKNGAADALSNPWIIGGIVAVVGLLVIVAVKK